MDLRGNLRIAHLMAGYLRQTLTGDEHEELDRWVTASGRHTLLFEDLTDPNEMDAMQKRFGQVDEETDRKRRILLRIAKGRQKQAQGRRFNSWKSLWKYRRSNLLQTLWPKLWQFQTRRLRIRTYFAVGSLIGALVLFAWLYQHKNVLATKAGTVSTTTATKASTATTATARITTQKAQPLLLLQNGDTLRLQAGANGTLVMQGNSRIEQSGAALSYRINPAGLIDRLPAGLPAGPTVYNTLTTPAGTQFQLTLCDGTRVWLNAASSLRYPVNFTGIDRTVMLQGEAYFEVAKNAAHPFRVQAGATTVQVLGTHFNVDAYGDEGKTRTTLLEGLVEVSCLHQTRIIRPGQQARSNGKGIDVCIADVEAETAWKNGWFLFRNTDARTLLAQLSRWYGVDIVYRAAPSGHFNAVLQRSEPLEHLLQILSKTGNLHITHQNNQLIIQP